MRIATETRRGRKTKTGVHINWPGFIVNQASALAIREHVIVALVTAKGVSIGSERSIRPCAVRSKVVDAPRVPVSYAVVTQGW